MIALSDITSFDVIVVLLFLLYLIRGTWIGFMRQFAIFVALVGSYLLAGSYTGTMMPHVGGFIENPKTVFYISFFLLFLLGSVFLILTGKVLRLVVQVTMTPWFDRTLGMLLGIIKAVFITSILYMVMASSMVSSNELLKKSITAPFLAHGAEFVQQMISELELRDLFQPKEPAIPPEELPDVKIDLPPLFDPGKDTAEETRQEER